MPTNLRLIESPETQREHLITYLKDERVTWLGAQVTARRSDGMDGHAVREEKHSMWRINAALQELFKLNVIGPDRGE